jgi:hypothetical protein
MSQDKNKTTRRKPEKEKEKLYHCDSEDDE